MMSRAAFFSVLAGTALFGFSYYSAGFTIIVSERISGSEELGVLSYTILMAASSLTGFALSRFRLRKDLFLLSLPGYLLAGISSLGISASIVFGAGLPGVYTAVALLGVSLGFVETLEPTIISRAVSASGTGRGMGSLSGMRSVGLFLSNLAMGTLFSVQPYYAFYYATAVSTAAAILVMCGSILENRWKNNGAPPATVN
ncbi:hypothetical protein [Thermogymnomonas acidicola]|uniref:hypothetical protein n=1 Tax=Thermogymnomonas acidicola TaxID=399579 RepID=UPI0009463A2E|nr:hypothetical protein [Thermogymnomonas acidicola]